MTIQGKKNWNDCQKAKCVKGQLEFYAGVYNALLFNKKRSPLQQQLMHHMIHKLPLNTEHLLQRKCHFLLNLLLKEQ